MGLETTTYVSGLNASNPAATDGLAQADDHLRLIKSTLKNTLPNLSGAVTATQDELNVLDGATVTTDELNILAGAVPTTTEVNYLSGVTSAIQDQLNTKALSDNPTFTGAVNAGDKIVLGSWEIHVSGPYLYFKHGTNDVFRMDSDGHFRAEGDISAFNLLQPPSP